MYIPEFISNFSILKGPKFLKKGLAITPAKFGISFQMTEKVSVKGSDAHPFYHSAKKNFGSSAVPKWNFHKIIINKEGKIA